jgi:hypothetical protein
MRRFLAVLEHLGLVESVPGGEYRATALARHLRRETGSLYGYALMAGKVYYEAWADIDVTLRTGASAFSSRHGQSLWALLDEDSQTAEAFTRTMSWNTERTLDALLRLYPFPSSGLVADIGAGDGTITKGLLTRFPQLRAIVFERPSTLEAMSLSVRDRALRERCEFVAGDFFDQVPGGADIYLLKSVIHNWDDDSALRILGNCRRAMTSSARLLLIEHATDAADTASSAMRDMIMLVLFGSQDRTAAEYGRLLRQAGFEVNQTRAGPAGLFVLEAVPASSAPPPGNRTRLR